MGAVIETEDLWKFYGRTAALRGLSLSIAPGRTALVGPNGAGKTTLLRLCLGLLRGDRGGLRVLGLDPARCGKQMRARIGFVPEEDCFWEGLSAVGSIQYAGRLSRLSAREALKRAHLLLDRIGLGEERYRPIETFSIGMRQKVRIAQAIVHRPEFLILDEPTRFLDPQGRADLRDWLLELHRDGTAILLSTHELGEIEAVCESVALLMEGVGKGPIPLASLSESQQLFLEIEPIDQVDATSGILSSAGIEHEIQKGIITVKTDKKTVKALINNKIIKIIRARSVKINERPVDESIMEIIRSKK